MPDAESIPPASKKAAKAGAPKVEKGQPREGSKKQIVLDLLSRKDGFASQPFIRRGMACMAAWNNRETDAC